jgi:hypothetical protein
MKIEINATTGEVIEREYTQVEIEQEAKDHAEFAKIRAEEQAELQAKETAKAALLAQLGITEEQAKLLLS